MSARRMTLNKPGKLWVPSDVNLSSDPAILRAGAMAELLFRRGNEHAKKVNRDGILYFFELRDFSRGIPSAKKHAETLVREGLWEEREDHWFIRSYLKWNPSSEQRAEQAERARLGAMKTNHARGRHENDPDPDCPMCEAEEYDRF